MAAILITCTPAHGHVYPLLTVAGHLAAAGHDVRFLTGSRYEQPVRAAGVEYVALPPAADIDLDHVNDLDPERAKLKPIAQLQYSLIEYFLKPAGPQVEAIAAARAARPVDVILTEMMFFGTAALVRQPPATRPPVITLGIFPLFATDPEVAPSGFGLRPLPGPIGRLRNQLLRSVAGKVFAPAIGELRSTFHALGVELPGDFDMFDTPQHSDLLLQFTVPSFEYPRPTLPAMVRFVGPMTRSVGTAPALPAWWGDLDGGRPVIHVSQGTVANADFGELIRPTLEGLEFDDVLVVVSTGNRPVAELGPLPENARAAEYLPYDRLFPKLSAFVTNGGYGGLHFALEHGVPIVAFGTSEDKLETTARVQWSGAGIGVAKQRPKPTAVARVVRKVLAEPSYRAAAERIGADIRASPGLAGVEAAIAEVLVADRQ